MKSYIEQEIDIRMQETQKEETHNKSSNENTCQNYLSMEAKKNVLLFSYTARTYKVIEIYLIYYLLYQHL